MNKSITLILTMKGLHYYNDQVNRTKVIVNNGYPYAKKNLWLLFSVSDRKALETNKEVGSTVLQTH